jgi:hypothetical protein
VNKSCEVVNEQNPEPDISIKGSSAGEKKTAMMGIIAVNNWVR